VLVLCRTLNTTSSKVSVLHSIWLMRQLFVHDNFYPRYCKTCVCLSVFCDLLYFAWKALIWFSWPLSLFLWDLTAWKYLLLVQLSECLFLFQLIIWGVSSVMIPIFNTSLWTRSVFLMLTTVQTGEYYGSK